MEQISGRKNYIKRLYGTLLCMLPLLLSVLCAIWERSIGTTVNIAAMILISMSLMAGTHNFYIYIIRPRLYQYRHGTMEGYIIVSGLPVVGTVLQVAACITAFGSMEVGITGIVSCIIDTGGLLWVPLITWNDSSLWDA